MKTTLEGLTDTNPNPLLRVAKDGSILYSNAAAKPLLHEWNVEIGEKLPSSIGDVAHRVISRNAPDKMEIKTGNKVFLVIFSPIPEQEYVSISGFDISDQKEVEEKLRESENKYRNIVETSVEGIWVFNSASETTYVNEKMAEMLGYKREEMIGSFIWDYAYEENKGFFQNRLANRKQGIDEVYEVKLLHKDGIPKLFSVSAKGFFENACKFEGSVGMFTDITDRRKAEEELQESKARIESIFRSSPVGIGVVVDRIIMEANERLCEMTGYSREELLGKSALILYPTAEEYERVGLLKYDMILKSGTGYMETRWQRKDGSVVDIFLSSSPIIPGDLTGEITFTALDITNRKQAEEALKKAYESLEEKIKERTVELEKAYNSLKESEERLAEAQRLAHIGNWDNDLVKGELHWSSEMYRIFGLKPKKSITYKQFLNYVHPDDRDYVSNSVEDALKGKIYPINHRIIRPNGEERFVHSERDVVFNEKNKPIRIIGTVQDITEYKKAEEKIQMLAEVVESSNDAIITRTLEGITTSWNNGAEQVFGYAADEIIGKNINILEPGDRKREVFKLTEKVKHGEKIKDYETVRLKKDGTRLNVSVTLSPVFDSSGNLTAVSTIARDITERIKAEEALAKTEEARIKEIHHRIKNNLQVISSLLDLQAEKFEDRGILEAFRESQNRVISMSLIHEELYKSDGLDTLDFSAYIKKLTENLFHIYDAGSKNIRLYMHLEENACFNMDISVPLGIIVNELVSNSLKHAFPGRKEGEIRIVLRKAEYNNNFILSVSDNGIGIPEDLDIADLDSLGLQLVTTLVEQIDGELELRRDKGTEFTIKFKVTEKDNQASALTM